MKSYSLLLVLLCVAAACKKSDPEPASSAGTYLVMNGAAISIYDVSNANLGATSYKPKESLADIVADNGTIYTSGKSSKTIDFINTKFYSVDKSPSYGKIKSLAYKHLAVASGKVFVSDMLSNNGLNDRPASIKVLSVASPVKADSIGISKNGAIVSLAASGGKVFVSSYDYFTGSSSITVLDANTNAVLSTIPLTRLCEQLTVIKDGMVLGLQFNALITINPANFGVTTSSFFSKSRLVSQDATTLNGSTYAYDEDANKIYFLAPSSFGGSVLSAFDLGTKTTSVLQTNYIPGSIIAYDHKNKVILVGSSNVLANMAPDPNSSDQGAIFFYSTSGELKQRLTIPFEAEKILVLN